MSPLRGDGSPHRGAAERDGVVLVAARRRKERTYPELMAPRSRARLVVLAMEVGGRWSPEALTFIRLLARAKARHEPNLIRKRVGASLADALVFFSWVVLLPARSLCRSWN